MTHPSPGSWSTSRGRTRGNRGGYPHFNNDRGYNHSNVRNYNQNNDRGYNQHNDRGYNQNNDHGYNQNNDRGYNQNNDMTWNNQTRRYSDIIQVSITQATRAPGRHVPNSHPGHQLQTYAGPQDNRPIPIAPLPIMFQPNVDMSVPPPIYPHTGMQMFHYPMIQNNPEPGQFIPTNEPVMPEIHHIPSHSIQPNVPVPIEVQYRPLESFDTCNIEKACTCEKCHFMNLHAYIIINNLIAEKKIMEDLLKSSHYKHQEDLELKYDSVQNGAQYSHVEEPSFQLSANAVPFVNEEYIPSESWSSGMDHQEKKSVNWKSDLVSVESLEQPCDASVSSECEVANSPPPTPPPVVSWADDEEEADAEMSEREEPTVERLEITDQPQGNRPRSGGDSYRERPRGNSNSYQTGGAWSSRGGGGNYNQQGGRPANYRGQGNSHRNYNQRDGPSSSYRGSFSDRDRGGGRRQNQGRSDVDNWRNKGGSGPEQAGEQRGEEAGGEEAEQGADQSSDVRKDDQQRGGAARSVVTEVEGDLFTAENDVSLAHCVAVDLRMGSGIAVEFRSRFGRLGELFDQYKGVGEVAILAENNRFLYYLITKELSRGKPTMDTLRRSLEMMRRHCVKHEVRKVAMPRIGCGLDRLSWPHVRAMLEDVFAGAGVHITAYNFPQVWERDSLQKQTLVSNYFPTNSKRRFERTSRNETYIESHSRKSSVSSTDMEEDAKRRKGKNLGGKTKPSGYRESNWDTTESKSDGDKYGKKVYNENVGSTVASASHSRSESDSSIMFNPRATRESAPVDHRKARTDGFNRSGGGKDSQTREDGYEIANKAAHNALQRMHQVSSSSLASRSVGNFASGESKEKSSEFTAKESWLAVRSKPADKSNYSCESIMGQGRHGSRSSSSEGNVQSLQAGKVNFGLKLTHSRHGDTGNSTDDKNKCSSVASRGRKLERHTKEDVGDRRECRPEQKDNQDEENKAQWHLLAFKQSVETKEDEGWFEVKVSKRRKREEKFNKSASEQEEKKKVQSEIRRSANKTEVEATKGQKWRVENVNDD